MGRTWSVEAGWDIYAMSEYHTIANFAESPVDENILWVGTDDGQLQVTNDGGKNWKKIELDDIKGVPATAYVNDIRADLFDPNTIYVALDNHKYGDFKPYLIKSTDLGRKWTSLADTLPEKHLVWRIVQDHVNKDLMFIGTEFGVFFTVDGGKEWLELAGFSVSRVLKQVQAALLLAPGRPVKWFRLDDNHTDTDGDDRFVAENPAHGATLTYYLKDSLLTDQEKRQEAEKKMVKDEKYPKYPAWEAIEAENNAAKPAVYIEITDSQGQVVNRVAGDTKKGLHRISWDMTFAPQSAVVTVKKEDEQDDGFMAPPGTYTATLFQRVGSKISQLAAPVELTLEAIYQPTLQGPSSAQTIAFTQQLIAADRRLSSVEAVFEDLSNTLKLVREAISHTPGDIAKLEQQYAAIADELNAISTDMFGLQSRDRMGIKPANIVSRLRYAMSASWSSYGPTTQHQQQLGFALSALDNASSRIQTLQGSVLPSLQNAIVDAGGPWTPGIKVIAESQR